MKRIQFLLSVCLVMVPLSASAQANTTAGNATPYKPGQGWITVNIDAANLQRWYGYDVVAGRSYCVEGVSESAPTMVSYDGDTFVFRADGTTPIGANDDYFTETSGGGWCCTNPGRVCYISDESGSHLARLKQPPSYHPHQKLPLEGRGYDAVLSVVLFGRRLRGVRLDPDRTNWRQGDSHVAQYVRDDRRDADSDGFRQRELQPPGIGGSAQRFRHCVGERIGRDRLRRQAGLRTGAAFAWGEGARAPSSRT